METQVKINESIQKIMDTRFFKTSYDGEGLGELCIEVDEITCTDKRSVGCGQTTIPYHSSAAVGIDHTIIEVTELFEWNKDKPAVAVLVYGIGGSGKTKLVDAVIACLNLEGFQSYFHKKYGVSS
ncbi:uncharacterized protein LOC131028198 [Cryptomeria japonica]|uniref:uncharacterized protein LOC131028198 n=1 Tax=Cryptomeria japonica TaxID=3369 RepID=UPI0025AD8BD9|nr:uncharacterized protein LOC131028198 [Cryptomeria japonica]